MRELVQSQLSVFSRQGAIVATWRKHQGRKLGPYYRLAWREEGGQRSRYLGCSTWVVEKVRELLARVQRTSAKAASCNGSSAPARAAMRSGKGLLRKELGRLGLWLKGFEVRGGRLAK